MILNIGCGFKKIPGAINLDIDVRCNPDHLHDLSDGIPFPDNHFDEIHAHQVLEHIFDFEDLMLEIHRALKLGGILEASVPLWPCRNAIAGSGHIRQFVSESFMIYTNPAYYQPRMHPSDQAGLFDLVKMEKREAKTDDGQVGTWITDMYVTLKKVDKAYWKAQGIQENLETEIFGCFYCQHELETIKGADGSLYHSYGRMVKVCPNCNERYDIKTFATLE